MTATVTRLPTDYLESLEDDDAPERSARASTLTVRDDTQIEYLPPIAWLADHIIPQGSLGALYGAPGSGKSFVALDLAFSLAAGIDWFGRRVIKGGTLYVAAEGVGGLGQRVHAWKARHELAGQTLGVGFATSGVNLLEPNAAALIVNTVETHSAVGSPCQFIVIDTLARCMIGDENDTGDMSRVIATIDRIREKTGATVLMQHHTRKDSDLERGSSALRGGVDTLILCEEGDEGRQLVCQKQKDAEAFAPIPFSLIAGYGSCVVGGLGVSTMATPPDAESRFTSQRLKALRTLAEHFTAKGATMREWQVASNIPERTFFRVRTWLCDEGYAIELRSHYTVTPSGKGAIASYGTRSATTANDRPNPLPSPFGNPLKGVPEVAAAQRNGSGNGSTNGSDDPYWSDLLAEADERLGMKEEE